MPRTIEPKLSHKRARCSTPLRAGGEAAGAGDAAAPCYENLVRENRRLAAELAQARQNRALTFVTSVHSSSASPGAADAGGHAQVQTSSTSPGPCTPPPWHAAPRVPTVSGVEPRSPSPSNTAPGDPAPSSDAAGGPVLHAPAAPGIQAAHAASAGLRVPADGRVAPSSEDESLAAAGLLCERRLEGRPPSGKERMRVSAGDGRIAPSSEDERLAAAGWLSDRRLEGPSPSGREGRMRVPAGDGRVAPSSEDESLAAAGLLCERRLEGPSPSGKEGRMRVQHDPYVTVLTRDDVEHGCWCPAAEYAALEREVSLDEPATQPAFHPPAEHVLPGPVSCAAADQLSDARLASPRSLHLFGAAAPPAAPRADSSCFGLATPSDAGDGGETPEHRWRLRARAVVRYLTSSFSPERGFQHDDAKTDAMAPQNVSRRVDEAVSELAARQPPADEDPANPASEAAEPRRHETGAARTPPLPKCALRQSSDHPAEPAPAAATTCGQWLQAEVMLLAERACHLNRSGRRSGQDGSASAKGQQAAGGPCASPSGAGDETDVHQFLSSFPPPLPGADCGGRVGSGAADEGRMPSRSGAVVTVVGPVYIFGDVHGDFEDLLFFLDKVLVLRDPDLTPFTLLFLGDYVDRGRYGVEVAALLLALHVWSPRSIVLLRGNHDDPTINGNVAEYHASSFRYQCYVFAEKSREKGDTLLIAVNRFFKTLPLAAVVDGALFCSHGGIPRWFGSGEDDRMAVLTDPSFPHFPVVYADPKLGSIPQGRLSAREKQLLYAWDLMWSDPLASAADAASHDRGFRPNPRGGATVTYDTAAVRTFLNRHGFQLLVRGHQEKLSGCRLSHEGLVLTVFSTSGYCGHTNNAAVVLYANGTLRYITKS
eukprot:gene10864-16717_t